MSSDDTHYFILMPDAFHPTPRYSTVPWPVKEEAEELMTEAYRMVDHYRRLAVANAKKALKLDPMCYNALALLADYSARTRKETVEYYRRAVDAAAFTLGEDFFKKYKGEFWTWECSRPYMKMLARLADRLHVAGQHDESLECYKKLLELNPDDSMGIRYYAVNLMIEMNHDEDAEILYKTFRREVGAFAIYTGALLAFRKSGDTPTSRQRLKKALAANRHAPAFLLDLRPPSPTRPDGYAHGDESEAENYAEIAKAAWKKTPGALAWLRNSL